jgi:hypothetical protein
VTDPDSLRELKPEGGQRQSGYTRWGAADRGQYRQAAGIGEAAAVLKAPVGESWDRPHTGAYAPRCYRRVVAGALMGRARGTGVNAISFRMKSPSRTGGTAGASQSPNASGGPWSSRHSRLQFRPGTFASL